VIFDNIETGWMQEAGRALAALVRAHPQERIYAAAFHIFCADDLQILPPALAANAESAVILNKNGFTWSTRWAPPGWRWDVLETASDAMRPLYAELSQRFYSASVTAWEKALTLHDDTMARVARKLTAAVRNRHGEFQEVDAPRDFVVAILEGQRRTGEYNRLVRASVDPAILRELHGILIPEGKD